MNIPNIPISQIVKWITDWMNKPDPEPIIPNITPIPSIKVYHLKRLNSGPNGIFSLLYDDTGKNICAVAEHAYDSKPKVPNGTWLVKRGMHQLDHGGPQELFALQDVPGHQGICFHKGNFPQTDSDGCLLLGEYIKDTMVSNSQKTFDAFMASMVGIDEFQLVVS